jgi:uncharacterized repeat protein (TIGR02543 family)
LQAQWAADDGTTYTIFYRTNGSTHPTSVPDVTLSSSSDPVPLPTLEKTGYTFDGWYVGNDGTGVSNSTLLLPGGTPVFSDLSADGEIFIVLEAEWTPKTYTVEYHGNNGSGVFDTRTDVLWHEAGLVPAPGGTPSYTAHIFMGWNTASDGTGRNVTVGDAYATIADGDDAISSITLYAQWLAEPSYFVRYDLNGAQSPLSLPDLTGVHMGTNNLLPSSDPTPPAGFDFSGWAVSFNGSKQGVTNDDTFGDLAENPNAGYIILKAQWYPKSNFTVVYDANGGTLVGANSMTEVVWTQTNLIPPADPSRTGYVFVGWNTASDGTGIPATISSTFGELAGGVEPSDNTITLFAQ